MFRGYLTIAPVCQVCGLKLGEHDSGDGPAVLLIFILGALVVPMALWVASIADWPLWLHTIVWGVVILGMTVGMLRPAKALTLAAQYRRNAAGPDWRTPS